MDDADVERRPAHVDGDDVRHVSSLGDARHRNRARDRPGMDGPDGRVPRLGARDRTAGALRELDRALEASPLCPSWIRSTYSTHQRPDVRVHDRGGRPFELTGPARKVRAARDEQVGRDVGRDLPGPSLVGRVHRRPQEADRDRPGPSRDEVTNRVAHPVLVERHDHIAVDIDALGDRADHRARHERCGPVGRVDVEGLVR